MTFTKSSTAPVPVLEQPLGHREPVSPAWRVTVSRSKTAVFVVEGLEVDHLEVDPLGEVAVGVVDVGDATRHARPEVPTRRAEDDDPSTGHVLAAVVADTFDDRRGARVAHAEALAHLSAHEALPAGRPVEDDVAGDDLLLGREGRGLGGAHHDPATRQPLGQVVVGVADAAAGSRPAGRRRRSSVRPSPGR